MPASLLNDEEREIAEKLLAAFESQDAEGRYQFEDAEVRHFVPALALMSGWSPSELEDDTPLSRLMDQFREAAGLPEGAMGYEWQLAAKEFYEQHPLHPELLARLRETLGGTGAP